MSNVIIFVVEMSNNSRLHKLIVEIENMLVASSIRILKFASVVVSIISIQVRDNIKIFKLVRYEVSK